MHKKNIKKSQKIQKNFINVLTFVKKCCNINKHLLILQCLWAISSGGRALDF